VAQQGTTDEAVVTGDEQFSFHGNHDARLAGEFASVQWSFFFAVGFADKE
jgi:hypothetical protein